METIKLKVLFVCTVNRLRSATAHHIYRDDPRFEVRSAGTDPSAIIVMTHDLLAWADVIVVMEKVHRNRIRKKFPDIYAGKKIICLYIPDRYEFMQPELVRLLKERFEAAYEQELMKGHEGKVQD
jgi:predicted protein tyrosine phosphatase